MSDIPERLRSALAGRYPIQREIGSGGMATVYLAHDLKLDRQVAVKVLRSEYAATVGSERFMREIDVAAKMTHPHILPLYDSGQANDFLYYVMPYVKGESLRERLEREKRLSVEEAVRIARQVADALSYAHGRGIVHRDIKPENILMEEGEAVVADFGIFRAITAAAGDTLTASGMTIGTPQYMSPEQAAGDSLDARTDVYSLGCVLFEMVSGKPPFTGPTAQSVISQHITEQPPSLRHAEPKTPPWLDNIVSQTLVKKPDQRLSTAELLSQSLLAREAPPRKYRANLWQRWVARVRRRPAIALVGALALIIVAGWYLANSGLLGDANTNNVHHPATNVGVLPFQDFSQAEEGPLAAGFTTYLTQYLGGVEPLNTVSAESMRRYVDKEDYPVDSIVARHHLGTLIEGDLIATAEQVQVSVRLTDALSRTLLAGIGPLTRPRGEITLLLVDLSEEVGRLLRQRLGRHIVRREAQTVTDCADCLENVFRATELREHAEAHMFAGDSTAAASALDEADSLLAIAESGDPDWIDPIVGRGWVAATRAQLFKPTTRTYDLECTRVGMGHAERALAREPSNPTALELRGILRSYLAASTKDASDAERLWSGAEQDLATAVESDPSLAKAWSRLSLVYWERGRQAEAKAAAERALEEDVWYFNDETTMFRLCQATFELEQIEEAHRWCVDEGRQRFPGRSGFVSFQLTLLASPRGPEPDIEQAWQLGDTLISTLGERRRSIFRPSMMMIVAAVIARAGLADSARAVIRQARAIAPTDDVAYDEYEAMARLRLGETDEVIRLLGRYLQARPSDKERIAKDWWWRPIREHPEFQALVE